MERREFAVIGLTGGIASGKSTVSAMLRDRGVQVIDADIVAREVVAKGSEGLAAIVKSFGASILCQDGSLNRKKLGAIVFASADERARLEAIVHPLIAGRAAALIDQVRQGGAPFVVYDAALLVEWGMSDAFDLLVVVALGAESQRDRVMARDGLSAEEAAQRIASQMPLAAKVKAADVVIDNGGTLAETEAQVDALLVKIVSAG